jgi:hypothetical protein
MVVRIRSVLHPVPIDRWLKPVMALYAAKLEYTLPRVDTGADRLK